LEGTVVVIGRAGADAIEFDSGTGAGDWGEDPDEV